MRSWPIFDEGVLREINHRSAEVHLAAALHMMAIAVVAGFLSVSGIGIPDAMRGNAVPTTAFLVIATSIFFACAVFVVRTAMRTYEEITAVVPSERARGTFPPRIATWLLSIAAVLFILLSIPEMGSTLLILMVMTGAGLGALSVSEFLTGRADSLRSSLVLGLAGAATAILVDIGFPRGETVAGFLVHLVMSAIVILECRLERVQVSWSGRPTGRDERVMRIILGFAVLIVWLVLEDMESSRYD